MSARETYQRIGATQEEIEELIREQAEDEAADREEPLPDEIELTLVFSPGDPGIRKCEECGARVLALPRCSECDVVSDDHPF